MKPNGRVWGLAILGAAAFAVVAVSQEKIATGGDDTFTKKAAIAGMTEVEASKVALQKTTDTKVRAFAQHMIDDHTKAAEALKSAASQEGISVPKDLDAEHKKALDKLKGLSGMQFDAAYKTQMLNDHKEAVALFQDETRAPGSAVAKFAGDTLPTLQGHLKMAEDLAGPLKGGGR